MTCGPRRVLRAAATCRSAVIASGHRRQCSSACSSASFATSASQVRGEGSLLLKCRDTPGIVAGVTECLHKHGSNLRAADLHLERCDGSDEVFVFRVAFDGPRAPAEFEKDVEVLIGSFSAEANLLLPSGRQVFLGGEAGPRVLREAGPARVGLFVSKQEHCLVEILNQVSDGDLEIRIPFVLSNHPRHESSLVRRFLSELGTEYVHVPHNGRPREAWESDIRDILGAEENETDFLVLARYMQVLSGDFLSRYGKSVLNIHHGLLPSFKGANPFGQAYQAGVKLIGATAHFVTEDLDEGPIIEQRVARVSHKDNMDSLRRRSENLESRALLDAVSYMVENRIARVQGRTVVFT